VESVVLLLVVLSLSLLITRVATVALTLTGLARELARFQARSALTGVGFTTSEAEKVVHHPVRRRIIMLLMLVGNAGVVTAIASLVLAFANPVSAGGWLTRIGVLLGGIALLWGLSSSSWIERQLRRLIERALRRWTDLDVRDYASLLRLAGDHTVSEILVNEGDWLANKTLAELAIGDEGILVLGIQHVDGTYSGTPTGGTSIRPGETLLLYGRERLLADLDTRRAGPEGDEAHRQGVLAQQELVQTEDAGRESPSS
jgi:hypothetical protein